MNAADVMTRNVMTIQANASLADAIRLLLGQRISGLPVLNAAEELVGMLTEGDLLRRAETGTAETRAHWVDFLMGPGRQAAALSVTRVPITMSSPSSCNRRSIAGATAAS